MKKSTLIVATIILSTLSSNASCPSFEYHYLEGNKAYDARKINLALKNYQEAYNNICNDRDKRRNQVKLFGALAEVHKELGNYNKSRGYATIILSLDKNNRYAKRLISYLNNVNSNSAEISSKTYSSQANSRIRRSKKSKFNYFYRKGNRIYGTGNYYQALSYYHKAYNFAQTDKEKIKALGALAQISKQQDNYNLAKGYAEKILLLDSDNRFAKNIISYADKRIEEERERQRREQEAKEKEEREKKRLEEEKRELEEEKERQKREQEAKEKEEREKKRLEEEKRELEEEKERQKREQEAKEKEEREKKRLEKEKRELEEEKERQKREQEAKEKEEEKKKQELDKLQNEINEIKRKLILKNKRDIFCLIKAWGTDICDNKGFKKFIEKELPQASKIINTSSCKTQISSLLKSGIIEEKDISRPEKRENIFGNIFNSTFSNIYRYSIRLKTYNQCLKDDNILKKLNKVFYNKPQ